MASKNLMDFEKAIEYMDPMQVTDYLHKTLDFLQRNNNEMYFPSISPYVEAFLVNLVSDTRNLMSKSFKYEDRKLASEIIEYLEISRDVFRWTHSYENGNLLVYKKIFTNKMKKKPKSSSIAHRLLQAQTQQSTPPQSPTTGHALDSISQLPDIPATSTSFKLRFLSKTLRFIKDDTESTLNYNEMPLDLAEYIYSLIKYRDKDVGFGYKSLYAPLWEAMEEYGVDYKFEVMLEETGRDTAVLKLKKVPKNNKSKRDKLTKKEKIPETINNNVNGQENEEMSTTSTTPKQELNQQKQAFVPTGASSKSLATGNTIDRSMSKDRIIQFQKGGKLPGTGELASHTENEMTKEIQQDGGRSRDGISKRTAKLLEDLSTPVESDRGIRMMRLMGWNGGALGARGNGIMEPVMPNIEQPVRGGLGHVPPPKPPKATSRRPLDFRLRFLHSIYDLILHEESQKEIQLKEPLVKKETNFVQAAMSCLNKRRCLSLTEQENELVTLIVGELAGKPGVRVRHEFSNDFKTVTLHKLTNQSNQPVKIAKVKSVKRQPEVITITDDDVDVLVTEDDVCSVVPHVDVGQTKGASHQKTVRKRATRLLVLTKLAEVLHWDCQFRIVFKFNISMTKKLTTFIHTIIDGLNNGEQLHLVGWETQVYADLWEMVQGSTLTWEKLPGSKYVLRRTPLISEDSLPNAGRNLPDNNNDYKTDNRNQIINIDDCTEQIDIECNEENDNVFDYNDSQRLFQEIMNTTSNLEDATSNIDFDNSYVNVFEYNDHNQRLVQTIMNTSNLNDATSNIDSDNKDDNVTGQFNEIDSSETSIQGGDSTERIVVTIKNNTSPYIRVKDVNSINAEVDRYISKQNEKLEAAEVEINTECNIAGPSVKESDVAINNEVNNNEMTEEVKIKFRDMIELSDLERGIQDLEMTVLNVDSDSVVKVEVDAGGDLETASRKTDLSINIKKDKDSDLQNSKRSHSGSVCSEELDAKKVKICCDTDEHVVIITPKNQDEEMTHEMVKQVQTLMTNQLDKAGGFLPLLQCHGVQNGGLIYSCHDEDDVAWLKKVMSVGNLDVVIVSCDHLCSEKKIRELLIKINSYIPLAARKIFRKFEIYNVGLDTKYWKVSYKHTGTTFVMFIVTVDEKSFKYISDEKFSLYCGIDKAQFSIIY